MNERDTVRQKHAAAYGTKKKAPQPGGELEKERQKERSARWEKEQPVATDQEGQGWVLRQVPKREPGEIR